MRNRRIGVAAGALLVIGAIPTIGSAGAAAVTTEQPEVPIVGTELDRAVAAALAHVGGGVVTDSEVGDEESKYEVEVTHADGTQVDVQLDEGFAVVGVETDGVGDD